MGWQSPPAHNIHPHVIRSPIYLCALAAARPYYDELAWKTMCWSGHLGLFRTHKCNWRWESWALSSNDNVVMGPPVVAVGNHHPPMQKPLPMKGLFQPSPATHLEHLANQVPTSSFYPSHNDWYHIHKTKIMFKQNSFFRPL